MVHSYGRLKILRNKYSKKYKIIARLMQKDWAEFKEVELEKYGNWGPRYVFCISHFCAVGSVDSRLENKCLWQMR